MKRLVHINFLLLLLISSCAPSPPNISISSDLSKVDIGEVVSLEWKATDVKEGAIYCVAEGDWNGIKQSSGTESIRITRIENSFRLRCENSTTKQLVNNGIQITGISKILEEFTNSRFMRSYNMKLVESWSLGSGGKNYDFGGASIQIEDGLAYSAYTSNINYSEGVEFAKIFFPDIDSQALSIYLKENLNLSVFQIMQAKPFQHKENTIFSGSVYAGNTLMISFNPRIASISNTKNSQKDDYSSDIQRNLESSFLKQFDLALKKDKLQDKYPLLSEYKEEINLITETQVYLYYDGLDYGTLWTEPGAARFGAEKIANISFSFGPVRAHAIAHKELPGGRNYFYVILRDIQGWIGRPYVMKDKDGEQFLMPNPLTGEAIRQKLDIDVNYARYFLKEEFSQFIPSYESIEWNIDIPEKYRKQGYELYRQALSDGEAEVDRLVNSYLLMN